MDQQKSFYYECCVRYNFLTEASHVDSNKQAVSDPQKNISHRPQLFSEIVGRLVIYFKWCVKHHLTEYLTPASLIICDY